MLNISDVSFVLSAEHIFSLANILFLAWFASKKVKDIPSRARKRFCVRVSKNCADVGHVGIVVRYRNWTWTHWLGLSKRKVLSYRRLLIIELYGVPGLSPGRD